MLSLRMSCQQAVLNCTEVSVMLNEHNSIASLGLPALCLQLQGACPYINVPVLFVSYDSLHACCAVYTMLDNLIGDCTPGKAFQQACASKRFAMVKCTACTVS